MMEAKSQRRILIYVDPELYTWVKAKAASVNVSMTRYIEGLIAEAKIEDKQ